MWETSNRNINMYSKNECQWDCTKENQTKKGTEPDSVQSKSLVRVIECGKFQHSILNKIFDLAAEQQEEITLCKVPAHTCITGN